MRFSAFYFDILEEVDEVLQVLLHLDLLAEVKERHRWTKSNGC